MRGLSYALTELADRIKSPDATLAKMTPAAFLSSKLQLSQPIVEQPATRIRSMMKSFTSDVEDKHWFNDRDGWPRYLSMLAAERFNRFNLAVGIGYDFARNVSDAYFYFAYPFLLAVPGYDMPRGRPVRRRTDSNLEMLRFISDEAAARGLHFQLGIWTHAYNWTDSPGVNYVIEGLTPQTHAPTAASAAAAAAGMSVHRRHDVSHPRRERRRRRQHYDFWKTVFDGVVQCGRQVEIDMHAKGMDQRMIDVALATGMPVNVSPKSWAEHVGMPYQQAAIRRARNAAAPGRRDEGFFARVPVRAASCAMATAICWPEDRRYGVLHRIWPGTQRLLLWGDPDGRRLWARFGFCGSAGLEWCEPLSFKGRKGSGLPGGRTPTRTPR